MVLIGFLNHRFLGCPSQPFARSRSGKRKCWLKSCPDITNGLPAVTATELLDAQLLRAADRYLDLGVFRQNLAESYHRPRRLSIDPA
jgi:hypothetical protein